MRLLVCISIIGSLWGSAVQAAEPSASPWTGPATVQVYREAGDAQPQGSPETPPPVVVAPAQDPSPDEKADRLTQLETQVDQVNQNAAAFQQSVNTKIDELNAQTVLLRAQIKQLENAMLLLNRHFNEMQSTDDVSSLSSSFSSVFSSILAERHAGERWGMVALAFIVIIGLGILGRIWFVRQIREAKKSVNVQDAVQSKDKSEDGPEYDYMGSEASVPVKLNLARAYIAMEDYPAARKVIAEILQMGNPQQREEAARLEASIP